MPAEPCLIQSCGVRLNQTCAPASSDKHGDPRPPSGIDALPAGSVSALAAPPVAVFGREDPRVWTEEFCLPAERFICACQSGEADIAVAACNRSFSMADSAASRLSRTLPGGHRNTHDAGPRQEDL